MSWRLYKWRRIYLKFADYFLWILNRRKSISCDDNLHIGICDRRWKWWKVELLAHKTTEKDFRLQSTINFAESIMQITEKKSSKLNLLNTLSLLLTLQKSGLLQFRRWHHGKLHRRGWLQSKLRVPTAATLYATTCGLPRRLPVDA